MKLLYTYTGHGIPSVVLNSTDPSLNYCYEGIAFDYGRDSIWTHGHEFGYIGDLSTYTHDSIGELDSRVGKLPDLKTTANGSIVTSINSLYDEAHDQTNTGATYTNVKNQYLVNAYLDNVGNITYTYNEFKNEKLNGAATNASTHEILYTNNTTKTVVTDVHLENGRLSYNTGYLPDLTVSSGDDNLMVFTHSTPDLRLTQVTSGNSITTSTTYSFLTGITQAANGKITYAYANLNSPGLTINQNQVNGVITGLSVADHNITYTRTDISVSSGTPDKSVTGGTTDIRLTSGTTTYQVLTGITQAANGKITYAYAGINSPALSINQNQTIGVITGLSVNDHDITYTRTDISTDYGIADKSVTGGTTDIRLTGGTTTYQVLTGITQAANGKITYAYAGINSPALSINQNQVEGVVTSISVNDHDVTYTRTSLERSGSGDFLTTYSIDSSGHVTATFGDFSSTVSSGNSSLASATELSWENKQTSNAVVTNVNLSKTGDLTYTLAYMPDLTVSSGTADKSVTGGSTDIRLTGGTTTYQVLTGIIQAANGKITYAYAGINSPSLSIDTTSGNFVIGTTVNDHKITHTYGTFGANNGTENNNSTLGSISTTNTYISGVNIDSNGKVTYTYANVYHTNNGSTYSSHKNEYVSAVYIDSNGNYSYQYNTFANEKINGASTTASTHEILYTNNTTKTVVTDVHLENGRLSYNIGYLPDLSVSSGSDLTIATGDNATELSESSTAGHRFVTGITQAANGKITYQVTDIYTPALSINKNQASGVVTSISVSDHAVTYTRTSLERSGSGDFLTTYSIDAEGHVSATFGDFSSTASSGNSSLSSTTELSWATKKTTNVLVTNVNLSKTGDLTYTLAYMPDLAVSSGTDSLSTGNSATQLSRNSAAGHRFISNISQASNGKLTYTYGDIYQTFNSLANNTTARTNKQYIYNTDITVSDGTYTLTNTYTAHTTSSSTGDVSAVNTVNVYSTVPTINDDSHISFAETTYILPTKYYVDNLITANDALHYCGTASISASGVITLNPTTGDTTCGSVYKISNANGKLNNVTTSVGDMLISYSDSATTSSGDGWNVLQINLDLTNTGTNADNADDTTRVITNAHLNTTGDFTYSWLATINYTTTHVDSWDAGTLPSLTPTDKSPIKVGDTATLNKTQDIAWNQGSLPTHTGMTNPSLTITDKDVSYLETTTTIKPYTSLTTKYIHFSNTGASVKSTVEAAKITDWNQGSLPTHTGMTNPSLTITATDTSHLAATTTIKPYTSLTTKYIHFSNTGASVKSTVEAAKITDWSQGSLPTHTGMTNPSLTITATDTSHLAATTTIKPYTSLTTKYAHFSNTGASVKSTVEAAKITAWGAGTLPTISSGDKSTTAKAKTDETYGNLYWGKFNSTTGRLDLYPIAASTDIADVTYSIPALSGGVLPSITYTHNSVATSVSGGTATITINNTVENGEAIIIGGTTTEYNTYGFASTSIGSASDWNEGSHGTFSQGTLPSITYTHNSVATSVSGGTATITINNTAENGEAIITGGTTTEYNTYGFTSTSIGSASDWNEGSHGIFSQGTLPELTYTNNTFTTYGFVTEAVKSAESWSAGALSVLTTTDYTTTYLNKV